MYKNQDDIFSALMANKDFKDWVLDPTRERNLYWQKWVETNREHNESTQRARDAILNLRFKEDFLEEDRLEQILSEIISDKNSASHPKTVRLHRSSGNSWWIAAASFLILAVSSYLLREEIFGIEVGQDQNKVVAMKRVANPEGQKSKVRLPDGSYVNLNARSSLVFPEEFGDASRSVELTGEAFFDVAHDGRSFIVKAGGLETHVMGTSFNVRAYESQGNVSVALVTGKVRVSEKGTKKHEHQLVLSPGEKLTYNADVSSFEKTGFDLAEETGWKDEILVFRDTDFNSFVTRLERWYGVKIDVKKAPAQEWRVNGRFEKESLEEVLIGLRYTYKIEYKIAGKEVTLVCK